MKCYCLFFLFSNSVSVFAQVNLNRGLIAYYPFNGNAEDASGNEYHGVLKNGIKFVDDRKGNAKSAAYFDGVNDFIDIVNDGAFSNRTAFSFSLQFKPDNTTTVQTLLCRRHLYNQTQAQFQAFINWSREPGFGYGQHYTDNVDCEEIIHEYSLYVKTGTGTINRNEWHCITGTFDGKTQKIYFNGQLMDSVPSPMAAIDSCENVSLTIGKHTIKDPQYYKGILDEVRFYNRALNEQEIKAICTEMQSANYNAQPASRPRDITNIRHQSSNTR